MNIMRERKMELCLANLFDQEQIGTQRCYTDYDALRKAIQTVRFIALLCLAGLLGVCVFPTKWDAALLVEIGISFERLFKRNSWIMALLLKCGNQEWWRNRRKEKQLMIVAEIKTPKVAIRIHDDFFEVAHHIRMTNISQIVTDSYKRRQAETEMKQAVSIDSRTSV